MIFGTDDRTPSDYSLMKNKLVTKIVRFFEDNSIDGAATGVFIAKNFSLSAMHGLINSTTGTTAGDYGDTFGLHPWTETR
jgi:hypothetical protein